MLVEQNIAVGALGDGFLLVARISPFEVLKLEKINEIKILNVFFARRVADRIHILTADGRSKLLLSEINPENGEMINLKEFSKPKSQFSCCQVVKDTLVMGDTKGNLLLFDLN